MALPRTNYPKQGLPAPPGLHVEFIPGVGEGNREAEALINAVDGGTDLRVTLAAGSAPGISADLAALLAAVQSRGTDGADATRAVRSAVESLLYEMQHPKQMLYAGVDTVVGAGLTVWLTPWIDVSLHRFIGYAIRNSGANALATLWTGHSTDPGGAGAMGTWIDPATAFALGAAASAGNARQSVAALSEWTYMAAHPWPYFRLAVIGGAQGTTAIAQVWGMR